MDSDDSRSTSRPSNTSSPRAVLDAPAAPSLNDHVPQQFDSPPRTSSSDALPTHPFNLNFPTLNGDGSVPDLSTHIYRRQHSPTPPAALSSLGARLRMDKKEYASESEGSFTDNQYDMLDDLSEMSDGHDTASIASNGEDGRQTPDDSQSEADPEESTLYIDRAQPSTSPSASQSFIDVTGGNDASTSHAEQHGLESNLAESYLSDDLDTPMQSTMATRLARYQGQEIGLSGSSLTSSSPSRKTRHILIISERDHACQDTIEDLCLRVASCMDNATPGDLSTYKVVHLPDTPSGISPSSASVIHGQGSISATVQHCIGAEKRATKSFQLRVLDADGEHSTFFTLGENAKVDLPEPDIAIFLTNMSKKRPKWLHTAEQAVFSRKVPALFVADYHKAQQQQSRRQVNRKHTISIDLEDLIEQDDRGALAPHILTLLRGNGPSYTVIEHRQSSRKSLNLLGALYSNTWSRAVFVMLFAMLPYLLLVTTNLAITNPGVELSARREGLISALSTVTNSSSAVKNFDVEFLLPEVVPELPQLRCQGSAPNHLVMSFTGRQRFNRFSRPDFNVYKADGQLVAFNTTKLMIGIYDITIDSDQAYGEIRATLQSREPQLHLTCSHDFGSRLLQRRTYEKASAELGKEVSKDVALMKQQARSLSEKLPLTIGAGVSATRNVTSQLVVYVARDLQVIGNTAVSILSKAAQAGNQTASSLGKDLVLMQKDLVKFTNEVSTMVKSRVDSAKEYSKALIRNPIAISRERLQGFKKAGRKCCRYERSEPAKAMSTKLQDPIVKNPADRHPELQKGMQEMHANYQRMKDEWKKADEEHAPKHQHTKEEQRASKAAKNSLKKQEKKRKYVPMG